MSLIDLSVWMGSAMGFAQFLIALTGRKRLWWIAFLLGFPLVYLGTAAAFAYGQYDREWFNSNDRAMISGARVAIIWANLGLIAILLARAFVWLWRRAAPTR